MLIVSSVSAICANYQWLAWNQPRRRRLLWSLPFESWKQCCRNEASSLAPHPSPRRLICLVECLLAFNIYYHSPVWVSSGGDDKPISRQAGSWRLSITTSPSSARLHQLQVYSIFPNHAITSFACLFNCLSNVTAFFLPHTKWEILFKALSDWIFRELVSVGELTNQNKMSSVDRIHLSRGVTPRRGRHLSRAQSMDSKVIASELAWPLTNSFFLLN